MAFYNEDMEVEGISEGVKAFHYLSEFHPDLVMADVYLPSLNGFELSKQIKTSKDFPDVKVLLLTSDFEELDEIMYADSQADDYISKPFKTEDIIEKVKSLLADKISQAAASPAPEEEEDESIVTETVAAAAAASGGGEAYIVETLAISKETASTTVIELSPEDLVRPAGQEPRKAPEEEAEIRPLIIAGKELLEDSMEEMDELFSQLGYKVSSPVVEEHEEAAESLEAGNSDQPDLIREALSYIGETPGPDQPAPAAATVAASPVDGPSAPARHAPDNEPPTLDEHIHDAIEKTMSASMRSEMAGLSDTIIHTVQQIVKEVAPNVIRQVVQEEIEQIKESEQH